MHPRGKWVALSALLLPAAEIVFPGCATLINGPRQPITVASKPAGARVFVNGRDRGPAPITVNLSRWGFHRLRVELDGYEPVTIPLVKSSNPTASWNLFIGAAPIVIDVVTGAVFELGPDAASRQAGRARIDQREWLGGGAVTITTVLKPDPGWRRVAQMRRKQAPRP
jgi:PEGA domain